MKKTGSAVVVLAAVLVLGGVAYASGIFKHRETPTEMMGGMINVLPNVSSYALGMDVNVINYKDAEDVAGQKMVAMHFDGKVARTDSPNDILAGTKMDLSLQGTVTPEPGASFSFAGDLRMLDKVLYMRVTEMPDLGIFNTKQLLNEWFSLDPVKLTKELSTKDASIQVSSLFEGKVDRAQYLAEAKTLYASHPFVTTAVFTGTKKIAGHTVRLISFNIDKNILADFLVANDKTLATLQGRTPMSGSEEEAKALLATMDFKDLSMGIGEDDHLLYLLSMTVHGNTEKSTAYYSSDMVFSAAFSDYDKPQTIELPADAKPIESLLGPLLGGAMGAR